MIWPVSSSAPGYVHDSVKPTSRTIRPKSHGKQAALSRKAKGKVKRPRVFPRFSTDVEVRQFTLRDQHLRGKHEPRHGERTLPNSVQGKLSSGEASEQGKKRRGRPERRTARRKARIVRRRVHRGEITIANN